MGVQTPFESDRSGERRDEKEKELFGNGGRVRQSRAFLWGAAESKGVSPPPPPPKKKTKQTTPKNKKTHKTEPRRKRTIRKGKRKVALRALLKVKGGEPKWKTKGLYSPGEKKTRSLKGSSLSTRQEKRDGLAVAQ